MQEVSRKTENLTHWVRVRFSDDSNTAVVETGSAGIIIHLGERFKREMKLKDSKDKKTQNPKPLCTASGSSGSAERPNYAERQKT